MSASFDDLDLSVLTPEYRAAFEALRVKAARVAELEAITQRQEHLIAELNQALHGRKSEKLSEDERQLAFEELETALAEVEEQKQAQTLAEDKPRRKRATARRNSRDLPRQPAAHRGSDRTREPRMPLWVRSDAQDR
jgi:transposase